MNEENAIDIPKLRRTVTLRFGLFALIIAAALFIPAGTADWWQAWLWMATWIVPAFSFTAYYLKADPGMIERRMRSREPEVAQRRIIRFGRVIYIAVFILPGFDRRFGWSSVPDAVVIAADALVLAGYLIFIRVMRGNRFAARTIAVEDGQRVITTGPYAVVRHPLYSSSLFITSFSPVALGSWPAAAVALLFFPMIVARILNEEKVLLRDLPGYAEYLRMRRYRLIPGIW
jgi:protein-S-isoprenylcysteine O-methyltransferase Ste14